MASRNLSEKKPHPEHKYSVTSATKIGNKNKLIWVTSTPFNFFVNFFQISNCLKTSEKKLIWTSLVRLGSFLENLV